MGYLYIHVASECPSWGIYTYMWPVSVFMGYLYIHVASECLYGVFIHTCG